MLKHSKIKKSLGFLLLLSSLQIASHKIKPQNFSYELLSNKEGLSQNSVATIAQDKYGFLWFGTEEGISRFDGHNFKNFKRIGNDSFNFVNPFVKKIYKDKEGIVWIGTEGGLSKYDYCHNDFENFSFKQSTSLDAGLSSVNDIIESDSGKLYLASDELIVFDKKTSEYFKFFIPDSENILLNNLLEDHIGAIWIGTNKGLYKKNVENQIIKIKELGDRYINDLHLDSQGNIWIGSEAGLFKFNPSKNSIKYVEMPVKHQVNIMYIHEDQDGCLWLCTFGDGLITSCEKKRIFKEFKFSGFSGDGVISNYINTLYEDQSGVIWIGLDGTGIIKVEKHKSFNSITAHPEIKNGLKSNRIFGLRKDLVENKIWISTYGSGVNLYDLNNGTFSSIDKKSYPVFLSDDIRDIYQLPFNKNLFWISTNKGISVYNKKLDKIVENYTHKNGLNHNSVFSITSDKNDNIWIASAGGLNKYNYETKKFTSFAHDPDNGNSINSNSCRLVFVDRKNNLWIGTKGHGLNRYDPIKNRFIKYLDEDGMKGNAPAIITSVYEDFHNNFWVGTYGAGLIKLNVETGKYISFQEEQGLSNNSIYGILEDNWGNLWISSNFGLSKFNIKNASFQNYYKEDGLQGNEFNDGAYCKLDNGEMYFGGYNGITYFNPQNIKHNSTIPQIAFTSFKKGDKEFQLKESINEIKEVVLSYKDIVVSFEFVSLNYIRNENNKYAYKLEGLTDEWINIGDKRSITFTSLDPGEYLFRVKGSNNDGLWNETGRSLKIIVTPPFYATLWFQITVILTGIFFFFYMYKQRIKNVQIQKEKLRKIVAERTQELEAANENLLKEIDERERAEEEVKRYIEELQESKDLMEQNAFDLVEINMKIEESEQKLKDLNAQKDKFFSIISHDLKSPFVALLGYTEILMEEFSSLTQKEIKEFISSINKASKNVYNLLENLLEWSRIQTGRIVYIPEYFNVHRAATSVIDLLEENAKRKNIKMQNKVENSGSVYADENMVNTIIRNLVSNAIKFTEENGEILIASQKINDNLIMSVKDTGLGMTDDTISKLFRIDVHHTTIGTGKEKGTGVGLILCKELVEKNGGEIWVESELGEGSEFKFSLPVKQINAPQV
ncbi:MAG: two-component regulator propeller domain-containing protein [Rhodothermaceae bacterium]